MNREQDKELAKWLVKHGHLQREQAQELFKKQSLEISAGRPVHMLELAQAGHYINTQTLADIQKQIPEEWRIINKPQPRRKPIAVPVPATPEVSEAPPASHEKRTSARWDESSSSIAMLPESTKHCVECQAQIPRASKQCPICAAALPKTYVLHCIVCYRLGDSRLKHCNYCGCNMHTGIPGQHTRKCRSCQYTLLPEQAFCLRCGTISKVKTEHLLELPGKILLCLMVILGYTGFFFAMTHLQQRIRPMAAVAQVNAPTVVPLVRIAGPQQRKLLLEAMDLARQEHWPEIEQLLEKYRTELDIHLLQLYAHALARVNQVEKLKSLVAQYPEEPYMKKLTAEYLYQTARTQLTNGDFDAAQKAILDCLTLATDNPLYFFWAGIIAYGAKDLIAAEDHFKKAMGLQAPWPECQLFMYLLKRKDHDTAAAAQHLQNFKTKTTVLEIYNDLLNRLQL